jgi:hypothetical protein
MNLFKKKSTLLKSGLAVAAIAVAAVNFSQANGDVKKIVNVSDANALNCLSAQSTFCFGYTSDGLWHFVSNAENQ